MSCPTCKSHVPTVQNVRGPGQRRCPDEFHITDFDRLNAHLHYGFSETPCKTACTHEIVPGLTALASANIIRRALEDVAEWT